MKLINSAIIVLLVLATNACQPKDEVLDCTTPTRVNISAFNPDLQIATIEWNEVPKTEKYLVEHYVGEELKAEYETEGNQTAIELDFTSGEKHRFNVLSKCGDDYLRALNAYINVPETYNLQCPMPTNIRLVGISDTEVIFEWDELGDGVSFAVSYYVGEEVLSYETSTNSIALPFDSGLITDSEFDFRHEFEVKSFCSDAGTSSLSRLACIASPIDIDSMLDCDEAYYCQMAQMASFVYHKDQAISGSPKSLWCHYCEDPYPCRK